MSRTPDAMLNEADQLYAEGEYDAGLMLAAAALGELEAHAAGPSLTLARALRAVGQGHHALTQLDTAASFADRALGVLEALAEVDIGEVGDTLHMRAIVHLEQGNLEDALVLLKRGAALLEAQKASHLIGFCAVLLTMAEVSQAIDELDDATALYQRVLDEIDGVEPLSESHAQALNALTSKGFLGLGGTATRKGEDDLAKDLLARAVEFADAAFGHGHPEMFAALTEVATLYRLIGDEDAALVIDEELQIARRMLEEAERARLDVN
jgi:tetratricopeptide (TPR) repeat protein